jgi:hypothetical protein
MDYVICIPSYKRSTYCNEKTLTTLNNHHINPQKIYVMLQIKKITIYMNWH